MHTLVTGGSCSWAIVIVVLIPSGLHSSIAIDLHVAGPLLLCGLRLA